METHDENNFVYLKTYSKASIKLLLRVCSNKYVFWKWWEDGATQKQDIFIVLILGYVQFVSSLCVELMRVQNFFYALSAWHILQKPLWKKIEAFEILFEIFTTYIALRSD